jgi:malonyl-CoA O-methyltransferase
LTAQEAYALWAPNYPPSAHNPLMAIEQRVVEPMIAHVRAARALDVGTGSGRYLPILAASGARLVVGVDFSLPMLARGEDVRRRVCGDARRLPFAAGTFDLVSSSLMVGDMADLDGWAGEISRVAAAGGHLIYSDFHPSWALKRWRRTFVGGDGRSREVAFFPHSIDDHLTALERAGFHARTIREPRAAAGEPPVIVAFHAVKR